MNSGAVGALDGEPTATLSDVLWRRHERACDQIYLADSNVCFRSVKAAMTYPMPRVRAESTFPK